MFRRDVVHGLFRGIYVGARTYPEGHAITVVLSSEVTFDESQPARILLPLTAKVGGESIDLDHCEAMLDCPKVLDRRSEGGQK